MKKTFLFLISVLMVSNLTIFAQNTPMPQFFGTYMVVDNNLNELSGSLADSLKGVGYIGNTLMGIKNVKGLRRNWVNDPNTSFIVYQKDLKEQPVLAKLEYKSQVKMKNSMTGQEEAVTVEMYIPTKFINLKTAPIEGKDGAFRLIPEFPLEDGRYVFDLRGRIKTNDAFAFTVEQNSKNDIWSFVVSRDGCTGYGKLTDDIIAKGKYTVPPGYGMWVIKNFDYVQIPVHRNSEIKSAVYNDGKYETLASKPTATFLKSEFRDYFIIFSEKDRRGGESSTRYLNYVPFKDMWPEKMYISKLKEIEVDMRSKREIKKNKPPKMEKVWIAEKDIPFDIVNNNDGRLSKIIIKEDLEPGFYSFHNGGINGIKATYGMNYNAIYSFEIK